MSNSRPDHTAVLELLLAAALWGFGFVAVVWSLRVLSAVEVTGLRFFLGAIVSLPFLLKRSTQWRELATVSFVPAVFLAATLVFQTWGLHYTTATKSGFITTLYVVFVPLLEIVFDGRHLSRRLLACVAMALIGTGLIVGLGFQSVNRGDLLTLVCAFMATGQIYWMGRVSPKLNAPFAFNTMQTTWAFFLVLPLVSLPTLWPKLMGLAEWPWQAWVGVLSLAWGSTVLAFYLQIRAQARLSATVSSLLFLLESPYAMGFSFLLLGQILGAREWIGAGLIFCAAVVATLGPVERR